MKPNAWLSVPLEHYEGHMSAAAVAQLTVLADLFERALRQTKPPSAAILGVAGGNGLDRIDPAVTTRILGIDIHPDYLEAIRARYPSLPGLQLHQRDLTQPGLALEPVALVHAALVFEHTGLGTPVENALSLVAPGGWFSVVLQLPSTQQQAVAPTGYASMQSLKNDFAFVDAAAFQQHPARHGFVLTHEETIPLPGGKAFWWGLFTAPSA